MNKRILKRTIISALGLIISGIGVGIFIFSNLGVDPASVFQTGLAKQLNISYGTASALMNVVILLVVLLVDKKYINISSVLAIFLIGYTADMMNAILTSLITIELSFFTRFIMTVIGCSIMASGIPIYIATDLGVGAIDLISEIISDKIKVEYRIIRVFGDAIFVIVGYLLGGKFGVGTLIAVLMTGPTVQFVRPIVEPRIKSYCS